MLIEEGINLKDVHVWRLTDQSEETIWSEELKAREVERARPHRIQGENGILFQVWQGNVPAIFWKNSTGNITLLVQGEGPLYLTEPDYR